MKHALARRRLRVRSADRLTIDVAAMSDLDNQDDELLIMDGIEISIIALANSALNFWKPTTRRRRSLVGSASRSLTAEGLMRSL